MKDVTIIIMRGISGSGKTALARQFITESEALYPRVPCSRRGRRFSPPTVVYCCADDVMIESDGVYRFKPSLLPYAHKSCWEKFTAAVTNPHVRVVIVDNTNIRQEHLMKYITGVYKVARFRKKNFKVVTIWAKDATDVATCFARNIHSVPEETVRRQHSEMCKIDPSLVPERTSIEWVDLNVTTESDVKVVLHK